MKVSKPGPRLRLQRPQAVRKGAATAAEGSPENLLFKPLCEAGGGGGFPPRGGSTSGGCGGIFAGDSAAARSGDSSFKLVVLLIGIRGLFPISIHHLLCVFASIVCFSPSSSFFNAPKKAQRITGEAESGDGTRGERNGTSEICS